MWFDGTLVIHVQDDPPIHEIKAIASDHKIAILGVMECGKEQATNALHLSL